MNGYKNILVVLPEDLHRRFKTKLAREGRTAKEFYITVTGHYARDEETKKDGPQKTG